MVDVAVEIDRSNCWRRVDARLLELLEAGKVVALIRAVRRGIELSKLLQSFIQTVLYNRSEGTSCLHLLGCCLSNW